MILKKISNFLKTRVQSFDLNYFPCENDDIFSDSVRALQKVLYLCPTTKEKVLPFHKHHFIRINMV